MRLIYLVLGWISGLLLAAALPGGVPLLWLLPGALALAALIRLRGTPWLKPLLFLVGLGLGGWRYGLVPQTADIARYNNTGGAQISGLVITEPDVRDDRLQFQLQAHTIFTGSQTFITAGVVLVSTARTAEIAYGDTVLVTGAPVTPAEFDTFSYADYLARSGIFSVVQPAIVERVAQGGGSPLPAALLALKAQLAEHIGRALPEPAAGLLTGILLGNERGIAPAVNEAFTRTGTAHLIAISGFNMAVISGVTMSALGQLTTRRGLAAAAGLLFIALYTVLVGANAAVVRAALMSSLLIVAPLLRRESYLPASLALVALLMTLHNPLTLWDVSFQLSFLAVLSLALCATPLTRWLDAGWRRLLPAGAARLCTALITPALAASLAAQILTTPLIALIFGRWSPLALPVNVLVGPVQTLLLFSGAGAALLALVLPALAQVVFWLALLPLAWTLAIVRAFARLPFADLSLALSPVPVALFFAGVMMVALLQAENPHGLRRLAGGLRRHSVLAAVLFAGGGLALLLLALFLARPDGRLHVWFLDTGHSNAILLQTPGGAQVLVDGGRFPSRLLTALGDRLPFHDRHLDLLILTHPDDADLAALPAVLARYSVGQVITGGQPSESDTYQALLAALAPYPQLAVRAGYNLALSDGVQMTVWNPAAPPALGDPTGDHALVLRVQYGEVAFLLTGDVNAAAQARLLADGLPPATVLQLPQHGAARSLADGLLAAVRPAALVLQSDPANRRGDPDEGTLQQLPPGVPLWRTDTGGTLHFWTDGRSLWVQPEVAP